MAKLSAPRAQTRPTERTHHGDTVVDPYEWLREKESPEVIAHLEAENAYTEQETAHLAGLRERIFQEIKGRTLETDLSVPTRSGAWWYYGRSVEGRQYGIQCRIPVADPEDWTPPTLPEGGAAPGEQIILDANVEAEGHEFFSLGSFDVSDDGTRLLYGVDVEGDERYTVRVRDLASGVDLDDELLGTAGGAEFSPDGTAIVYTTVDESWRPDTVHLHRVGTSQDDDTVLFHEPDERFWVGAGFTRSRALLLIEAGSSVTSETRLVPADALSEEARIVWPRTDGVEYSVEHRVADGADRLLILHNRDAPDFELVEVPLSDPLGTARVVVAHSSERRLEDVEAFEAVTTVSYRRDGLTRIGLLDPTSGDIDEIAFDEPLSTVGWHGNNEWAQPMLRFGYGSLVTPSTVLELDVRSGERFVRKQQPVLGDYDPANYEQFREWATAEDGTRVPISIVRRVGVQGPGPLHLYGYGSYEASMDPSFSIARLSMLDRGVTFAIAHVRGGGELGRHWYEDGKKLHKQNSFSDFVDVADHLIREGWTTPARLVAEGGSAGGLLMGAVANRAPDRFAGILAGVPFVDALTSILDPSLPLTVIEWDEWGDPLHDPEVYAYMKAYSPYENVDPAKRYPRILATTSLNDTRVLYVEPAKWVARLRDAGAPALMKIEMSAGHGGVSGRYNAWRERAEELAWLLDVLELTDTDPA
ncbi:S9 family peptidase [Plantibacter sp. CFBP 13570]|uniref:S9 family peptidase n=1 Tax=Plantibacter sp. CFBP 13570 TaxID=2775272 RepID=UPI001930BA71|nr:S9 family peptidase [Plantibacter sp. CFBP 13570]MBD8535436.1 S9 family peptidase [Plantibacter sp. CFBP 13570]